MIKIKQLIRIYVYNDNDVLRIYTLQTHAELGSNVLYHKCVRSEKTITTIIVIIEQKQRILKLCSNKY